LKKKQCTRNVLVVVSVRPIFELQAETLDEHDALPIRKAKLDDGISPDVLVLVVPTVNSVVETESKEENESSSVVIVIVGRKGRMVDIKK